MKLEIYRILSLGNCKIFKMCFFKLNNFMNVMIFEIVKFRKFLELSECKFLKSPKMEISEIFKIAYF